MAKFDPKSYAKNVVRSAGYIGIETAKGVNPALTSYISDTASTVRDMYTTAKELSRGDTTILKKLFGNNEELYKNVEKTSRNVLDDIRSGKFYNPEREKKSLDSYMKNEMGFDFDDIDFDVDENYGEDGSSSSSSGSSFDSLSKVQQMVTAASTDEITRNARSNTRTAISANTKLFSQVNNSLTVINSSILAFHQDLAAPLNNHIINSTNFYQTATEQLAKQTAILEHINSVISDRFEPKKNGFGNKETSAWEDIMGDGFPSLSGLKKHVTKNIRNSDLGMLSSFVSPDTLSMLFESGSLDSPIALAMTMALTSKLQNGSVGKSMNRLNSTLAGGFGNIASKIHNYNTSSWTKDKYGNMKAKNGFLSQLARIFDIVPEANNKIDTSKYNKGRAEWTGMDNKALTEVIPTQLAKIYSAITGQETEIYDYKSGRWIKAGNIKKEFDKAKTAAIDRASYDFKQSAIKDYIDSNNAKGSDINYRSRSTISFTNDYNKVMQHFVSNNVNIGTMTDAELGKYISYLARNNIIDKRNIGHIKRVFAGERKQTASNAVNNSRVQYNKFMGSAGEDSNFSMLANNSNIYNSGRNNKDEYKSTILGITDNKGNDIFFYLQSYYSQLESIKYSLSTGNTRKGRGGKANSVAGIPANFSVPDNSTTKFANIDRSLPGRVTIQNERDEYDEDTGEWVSKGKKRKATSKHDFTAAAEEEKSSPLSRIIDKITNHLSNIFIGDTPIQNAIREEGILGALKKMPSLIGESVTDAMKKLQEGVMKWASNMLAKFKESSFGMGMLEDAKSSFKNAGKTLLDHATKSAGNVVQWATGKRPNWAGEVTDVPQAYNGGYVNKSGMVSVSEGELIIPSEDNPFYHGRTNKSSQKAKESMNYRNWVASGGNGGDYWGSFRKGGTVKKLSKKAARKAARKAKNAANNKIKDFKEYIDSTAAGPMIESTVEQIKTSVDSSLSLFFGKSYGDVKDLSKEATNTIKNNAPKVASKGLLGAVIGGAMTGSGLGLLGGLAIGAGIEVVNHSDKISEYLFGSADGKKEGKLPAKVQNFLKKQLPDLAKSGAIGSILGAIGIAPGGLMGGFVLGAGVQMLSNNEFIKDKLAQALFGSKDINGERHGGIVGSLKVRVVDPMADFVKDGFSKIGDYLKKNFLAPVTKIFDPLKDWVKGKAIKFFEGIGKKISDSAKGIFRNIDELFDGTFGRLISTGGKLAKKLLGFGGNVASLPFKAVGAAGDKLEKHNIKMGYSSRNAKERLEIMGEENSSGYNKKLASLSDKEGNLTADAEQYIKDVNFFSNGKKQAKNDIDSERRNVIDTTIASLTNGGMGNPKLVKQLRNALNSKESRESGTFSKDALDLINNLSDKDMDPNTKKKVLESLNTTGNSLRDKINNLKAYDAKQLEFFKNHEELGAYNPLTGEVNQRALKEFNMQARTDMDSLNVEYSKAFADSQKEHLENLSEAKKQELAEKSDILGKQRNVVLNNILDVVQLIARKAGVDIPKKNNKFGNILANGESSDDAGTEQRTDTENGSNALQNTISKLTGGASGNEVAKSDEEKGYRYTHDSDGNSIKEVFISGKWQKDMTDSGTAEVVNAKKKESNLKSKFFSLFTTGAFFSGIKSLFGGDDKDEKKTTLWDKLKQGASFLFDKFFGEGSSIGSFISSIISGGGLGSLIQSALSSAISFALPAALVAAGIKGLTNVSEESAGTKYDREMTGANDDEDGGDERSQEAREKEQKRNIFQKLVHGGQSLEYKYLGKDMRTYKEDDYVTDTYAERVRDKVIQNTAGVIGGVGSLAKATDWATKHGGVVGKTISMVTNPVGVAKKAVDKVAPIGQAIGNNASKALTYAADSGKALAQGWGSEMTTGQKAVGAVYNKASAVGTKVADATSSVVSKIGSSIKNILTKVTDKLGIYIPEDAADDIASTLLSSAKEGATKLKSAIQTGAKIFYWANVINAITYGAQSAGAKEILGILDEPTLMQRALAAICNGINAAIPLIGGIIPTRTLVTVVYKVLSAAGVDFGNFENQRAVAESTVADYNAANGTTYDLKEYLYNVEGEATLQTRISHTVSTGVKKAKEGIKNFGSNIKETTGKVVDTIKTGASDAWNSVKSTVSGGVKNFASNTIGKAKTTVSTGIDYAKDAINAITKLKSDVEGIANSKDTQFKDIFSTKIEIDDDNPFAGIVKTLGGLLKVPIFGMSVLKNIGKRIFSAANEKIITPIKNAVMPIVNVPINSVKNATEYIKAGDIKGLWTRSSAEESGDENSSVILSLGTKLTDLIVNCHSTIPTVLSMIGHGVKSIVDTVASAGQKLGTVVDTSKSAMKPFSEKGDLKGLWKVNSDTESEGTAFGWVSAISDTVTKLAYTPVTFGNLIGNSISDLFTSIKSSMPDMSKFVKEAWTYATDSSKDMSTFDTMVKRYKSSGTGPLDTIGNGLVSGAGFLFKTVISVVKPIMSAAGAVADTVGGAVTTVKDGVGNAVSTVKNGVSGAINAAGETINNVGTNIKNWALGGSSGVHVSQKGDYHRFGNSNIDQNGCGPATAATILRAYGKNANLDSAAEYAKANGYVAGASGVGTRASYFGDILGANGISTSYTTSKKNINKAVGSGNPTVLLGQDSSNSSKRNSPFGPNPHYVVARGSDSKGNIVIDDPELGGTALYKKNILNKAKLGIMTGGASGVGTLLTKLSTNSLSSGGLLPLSTLTTSTSASNKATKTSTTNKSTTNSANLIKGSVIGNSLKSSVASKSSTSKSSGSNVSTTSTSTATDNTDTSIGTTSASSGNSATNNIEAIWGYYKKLGLSDDATAGIMGNIHAESGETFNPKTVEGGLINHLKGKSYSGKAEAKWQKAGNIYADAGVDLTSKQTVYDTYTAAVDSGKISSDEFQNPYKMLNNADYKSNKAKTGHEWLQFGYGLTQFTSPSLKKELYDTTVPQGKSIGDLGAQLDVLTSQLNACGVLGTLQNSGTTYSTAAETMLKKYEKPADAASQVSKRVGYAKQYLDAYKGKTYDIDGYVSSSGTTFSNVASSTNELGQANTAAASSSTTGSSLSSILSSFFSNLFTSATNNTTGKGKSILSLIFSGLGGSNSSSTSTGTTTSSDGTTTSLGTDGSISTTVAGDDSPSYGGKAKAVPTDAYGKGTPEAMVKIAQSQLGVCEGYDNISDYGKFTGTDGAAWCAAFVSWVMDQTFGGNKEKRNKALRGPISAAVSGLWSNFKSANAMTNTPQPGDVVIFKKSGSHTGIVETVNGNTITTIEGNTGTDNKYERNGGGVARHQFTIGDGSTLDAKLTGFGRPDWSGSGSGLPIYNFTGKDVAYAAYKGGNSGTDLASTNNSVSNAMTALKSTNASTTVTSADVSSISGMSSEKKAEQILIYLKQLVANTGYNVSIPEIVDVLKDQANIIANLGGTTVVNNSSTSAGTQDTQNQITTDISKMMAKMDAISQAL